VRTLHCALISLALLLACASSLQAQTLPLVTVQDGSQVSAWWATGQRPQLSSLERGLLEALQERQAPVLDPTGVQDSPRISRIYRSPALSPANAVNLAGLYRVDHVLTGVISVASGQGPAASGLVGTEARAAVSLRAVPSGTVLLEVEMTRQGFDADPEVARRRATEALGQDLADLVAGALESARAPVGVERTEPFLMVAGLWDRGSLRQVEIVLERQVGVQEARLAWLAEGVAAFDINPAKEEPAATIVSLARALVGAAPEGIKLALEPSGGQAAVRASRGAEP
jgi:hypothetical protein